MTAVIWLHLQTAAENWCMIYVQCYGEERSTQAVKSLPTSIKEKEPLYAQNKCKQKQAKNFCSEVLHSLEDCIIYISNY
jgi:hypothetical protein